MTEQELKMLRLAGQITAIEQVLIATSRALQLALPPYAEKLREMAVQAAQELPGKMTFPQLGPEMSDLYASELQEALEQLLQRVLQAPL